LLELNNGKKQKAYMYSSHNMQTYTINLNRKEAQKMRRSKLEMYIAILNVLANKGPLKMTHIMYKANLNCNVLSGNLDFLIKQNMIEERIIKRDNKVFAITQRGITVLKYFKELTKALPILEESRSQTNRPPLLY
jgi:predicted transcriptional regulator